MLAIYRYVPNQHRVGVTTVCEFLDPRESTREHRGGEGDAERRERERERERERVRARASERSRARA
jgi:hypothetical protein